MKYLATLPDRLRSSIQPGDYLTSNVSNRLVYEAANAAAALDIAMVTLRQIESTPRNAGARRNARATLRFIAGVETERWQASRHDAMVARLRDLRDEFAPGDEIQERIDAILSSYPA